MAAREDCEDCENTLWVLTVVPIMLNDCIPSTQWGNSDCVFIYSSKAAAEAKRAEISTTRSSGWVVFDKDIIQAATPVGEEIEEVRVIIFPATVMPSTLVKSAAKTG